MNQLEQWLDGGQETQTFDVKAAMPWNVKALVKDILAMANVRDGGTILIGVEDKTFARQGVIEQDRATYDIDIMRDQLARYADPHVEIGVNFPSDRNGLVYVAIQVATFREIPVICRRNDQAAGVNEATIYYRNSNRRPQSAAISNSYDLRDVITLAATRTGQRLSELGFEPAASSDLRRTLDDELGGL